MYVIGLTGGIATGKTSVCEYLSSQFAIPIIDADIINKQLLEPEQAGYKGILNLFPYIPLNNKQQLDKLFLRAEIFSDPAKKLAIEKLLHPLIKNSIFQQIDDLKTHSSCVVAIPLLIEAHFDDLVDTIWVTDCSEELQLQRLLSRDKLSESLAKSMIKSQLSRAERKQHADAIIPTDSFASMQNTLNNLVKNFKIH